MAKRKETIREMLTEVDDSWLNYDAFKHLFKEMQKEVDHEILGKLRGLCG
jgi:hypothetical protein